MRLAVALCLLASPAAAWTFTADPVCTIWHAEPAGKMVVTYDPRQAEPYTIEVTLAQGQWRNISNYQIRFEGRAGFAIATNRHRLSEDGGTVIASDAGFDNVLAGLERNSTAIARLGDRMVTIPLADAAPAVAKFRDCTVAGLS